MIPHVVASCPCSDVWNGYLQFTTVHVRAEDVQITEKDAAMRITAEGCIVIPLDIRRRLNFTPDVELDVEIDGDTLKLRRPKHETKPGGDLIDRMRGRADAGMSTDDIMALTRGDQWAS